MRGNALVAVGGRTCQRLSNFKRLALLRPDEGEALRERPELDARFSCLVNATSAPKQRRKRCN
jgi:hypothetical protein